eukprot:Em0022g897a
MAEDGNGFNCENSSSKNQLSTSEERRRASKEANQVWAGTFEAKKGSQGYSEAEAMVGQRSKFLKEQKDECYYRRECIQGIGSLAVHMPNVSGSDARALVLH